MSSCADLPNAHALLDICGCHPVSKPNDEFGNLLDVYDIFILLIGSFLTLDSTMRVDGLSSGSKCGVLGYDLGTTRDLERVIFAHTLFVSGNVPEIWRREASVGFFDACSELGA